MSRTPAYPPADVSRERPARPLARIARVVTDSPAYEAGFEAGCTLVSVDGAPVRDIIDWRWLSAEDRIVVGYIDLDGEEGEVELWREPGEDWGFEFEGLVFDGVKQCRNACTFCFMRQLPDGMRPSLSLRDDDFRLSFLVGTFVTLTNLTPEDEARVIEQRISPLRVSLQASDSKARRRLIGRHAQHGLAALDRLLDLGIEFHAQIVLVPGENDGAVLTETLEWAYERPGILTVGIVPLGYTRHQVAFEKSFNDEGEARAVLSLIEPFQEQALVERGTPWVFAADEFYRNAFRDDLLDRLPPASHYGDFAMFEDGVGIIRSFVDDWEQAEQVGVVAQCGEELRKKKATARLVAGFAQKEFLNPLIERAGIADVFQPLYVENEFFGGNVDVTGLLTGIDIVEAIKSVTAAPEAGGEGGVPPLAQQSRYYSSLNILRAAVGGSPLRSQSRGLTGEEDVTRTIFLIPEVIFNDDGITLDDMTREDMEKAAGQMLRVVSCSPLEYFNEIIAMLAG